MTKKNSTTTNSTTSNSTVIATPNGETTFNVLRFVHDRTKKLTLGVLSETDSACDLIVVNKTQDGYVVNTTYPSITVLKMFDIQTADFRQTVLSTVNDYRRGQGKTHFCVLEIMEYDGLKPAHVRGEYHGKKPQSDKSLSSKIDSVRRQISVLKQKLVDAEKQLSELLEQQQQQQQLAKRADTVSALTSQLLSATTADERNALLTKLAELVNA